MIRRHAIAGPCCPVTLKVDGDDIPLGWRRFEPILEKYNYGRPVTDLVEENGYDNECFMFESVAEIDRTNADDALDHLTELLSTLKPSTNHGMEQLALRYETLRGLRTEHILPQQYLSVARLGFFANTVSTSLSCYSCGAQRELN